MRINFETLVRIWEETGCQIENCNCRVYSTCSQKEPNRIFCHIMVFYDVDINFEQQDPILEKFDDELNDSSGTYWIDLEEFRYK